LKQLGYYFFKWWVSTGLFFYYKSIKVEGLENVPQKGPIIFLSNHQNALLDIFLIATSCKRKPWYLTRADVFRSPVFRPLFRFLQMLPIYRLRDGKANLPKNQFTFERCAQLLAKGEAILLFPEANHSLKRRVRPLSKGFTRIIDAALALDLNMDLQLVPIGQNYQSATQAGDRAALYFGRPIKVQDFKNRQNFVGAVKQTLFETLTQLTTHIDVEDDGLIVSQLQRSNVDFTDPKIVNALVSKKDATYDAIESNGEGPKAIRLLFQCLNLPFIVLWRTWVKPKVPEAEFMATFRFGFTLLVYPLVYFLFFGIVGYFVDLKAAGLLILGHATFTLICVRLGITSNAQRK